jgi:hypothetical protein
MSGLARLQNLGLIERTTVTVRPGTDKEYTCESLQLCVPAEGQFPLRKWSKLLMPFNGPARLSWQTFQHYFSA